MIKKVDRHGCMDALPGIGPKKAEAFGRLQIFSPWDLLFHFPREYQDLRQCAEISALRDGEKALVCAKVLMIIKGKGFGRKRTLRLLVEDGTGRMEVLFFMSGYMDRAFQQGFPYFFYGKVRVENGRSRMLHPDFMTFDGEASGRIQPIYPLTKGLTQKDLRKHISALLSDSDDLPETLPHAILQKKKLCGLAYALKNIHFPEDEQKYKEARYRLIYEELFFLQVALQLSRERFGKGQSGISFSRKAKMEEFVSGLPYAPTKAQRRVLADVEKDMESARAMNRLIQGDVGSGKTLIALAALYKASKSRYQGAFMAPTELLARQHYETLQADLGPLGVRIAFLSGTLGSKQKKKTLDDLKAGQIDVIVGTHAIVSEGVQFDNLGLVITDEQHRFGVNQRLLLSKKGENPDVMVMTATPIPRTLAVVMYGDLDISVIDEMPPGRIPIRTERFTEETRQQAYLQMEREVRMGHQAYVVAPLIEDSEALDSRSAESLFLEIKSRFPDEDCALLHGNLPQAEKDRIMEKFYKGDISILVSTVVIEVGINVPNATVMLIENAERFGLAQLHQLRGRVGRGTDPSCCLIVSNDQSEIAAARAEVFCGTNDGFVIAEKDLELRGPGEVFGIRQHGLPELILADPVKHYHVFSESREDAVELLRADPSLTAPENREFEASLKRKFDLTETVVL
jgi:ATP-dependent DNA helicase RecG